VSRTRRDVEASSGLGNSLLCCDHHHHHHNNKEEEEEEEEGIDGSAPKIKFTPSFGYETCNGY
jgi:hypothetical protein